MKTNSTDKSLESVIYSLIRVTDCDSKSDLNLKVGQFATELYDEKRQELESPPAQELQGAEGVKPSLPRDL